MYAGKGNSWLSSLFCWKILFLRQNSSETSLEFYGLFHWRKLMASDFQPTTWTRTYRSACKANNLSLIYYAGELLLSCRNELLSIQNSCNSGISKLVFFGTSQINARKFLMFLAAYGFYIHFPVVLKQNKTKEQQTK